MMKKMLCLLLTLLLAVSAVGCGVVDKNTAIVIANTIIEQAYGNNGGSAGSGSGQSVQQSGGGGPGADLYLAPENTPIPAEEPQQTGSVAYGQPYDTKDEVALYLSLYGELPPNYITKNDAKERGWVASKGNLWKVTDHMSIGGDYFGNYEGLLPKKKGRKYYECDIGYSGGTRNGQRIIYSNDGLIYYTGDHYKSFTKLYGEE